MSKFEKFGEDCKGWLKAFSNRGQKEPPSLNVQLREQAKRESDRQVEATMQMQAETDPLKKLKMENRIANGIYDFSDL